MASDFLSRMRARAAQVGEASAAQVSAVLLDVGTSLALETPKDTWRATNGWQASTTVPVTTEPANIVKNAGVVIGRMEKVAETIGPDDVAYLSNPVPHIHPLNDGTSQQAPAGFVEAAVQRAGRAGGKVKVFKG